MGAPIDPIWEQEDYAFYTDGSETGAVIIGSAGSQQTLDVDTAYHCRLAVGDTNGTNKSNPLTIQWQYNLNGGGWTLITGTTPIQFVDNANLTDGEVTTNRQPVGSGTFNAGRVYESADTTTVVYTPPLTEVPTHTEVLLHLLIDAAQVSDADEILVRATHGNGVAFTTYINADIDVNKAAGSQNIVPSFIVSGNALYPPSLLPGSVPIGLGFIASGNALYTPTVEIPSGDAVPIARWLLDEASSGQAPTNVVDDTGNGNDLDTIIYDGANTNWTRNAEGNGLECIAAVETSTAIAKLEDVVANGNIASELNGATEASLIVVVDIVAGGNSGSRIFQLGSPASSGEITVDIKTGIGSRLAVVWSRQTGGGEATYDIPTGLTIITVIFDSADLTQNDRAKVYYDNVLQTTVSNDIPLDEVLVVGNTIDVSLLNRTDGERSLKGAIFYAELFKGKLTDQQRLDAYTALSNSNDNNWATPKAVSIARWLLNEASSGQSPTSIADDTGNGNDLDVINYAGSDANWTSNDEGNGLECIAVEQTSAAIAKLENVLTNGNIASSLNGATKASLILVVNVVAGGDSASRIFQLGDSNTDGEITVVIDTGGSPQFLVRWGMDVAGGGQNEYAGPTGLTIITVVYDSTEAIQADRIKLYYDNELQTPTSSIVPLNRALTLNSTDDVSLLNRTDGLRSLKGAIFYAELFTGKLTEQQRLDAYTALSSDNDTSWISKKLIQRGTAVIPSSTTTVTINAGADYDKPSANSFCMIKGVHFTGRGNGDIGWFVSAMLSTNDPANSIVFERGSSASTDTLEIDYEIWDCDEFPAGYEVDVRGNDWGGLSDTEGTYTFSDPGGVVNDDDIVVFITGQHTRANANYYIPSMAFTSEWLSGTNQPKVTRQSGATGSGSAWCSIATVEFTGEYWRVQRKTHAFSVADINEFETLDTELGAVSQTMIHAQFRSHTSNEYSDRSAFEIWIASTTQLAFNVEAIESSANAVVWVIEDISGKLSVESIDGVISTLSTTDHMPLTNVLSDIAKACIVGECGGTEGQGSTSEGFVGFSISSNTKIVATRVDANSSIDYKLLVVDFSGLYITGICRIPDQRLLMPALLEPQRKPVGEVEIDWNNPLADGLIATYLFNEWPVRNIINGFNDFTPYLGDGDGGELGVTDKGRVGTWDATGGDRGSDPALSKITESGGFTVITLVRPRLATSGTWAGILTLASGTTSRFRLQMDNTETTYLSPRIWAPTEAIMGNVDINSGEWNVLVSRIEYSGECWNEFYTPEGQVIERVSHDSGIAPSPLIDSIFLGITTSATNIIDGDNSVIHVWNRKLSRAEGLAVARDVFHLLKPVLPPLSIYFDAIAAALEFYFIPDPRWEMPALLYLNRKPVDKVIIDWDAPSTRDLMDCYVVLDGGAMVTDLAGRNNLVTNANSEISIKHGRRCMSITGSNGRIYNDSPVGLPSTSKLTVSFWCFIPTGFVDAWDRFINLAIAADSAMTVYAYDTSGNYGVYFSSDGPDRDFGVAIVLDEPVYVAVTFDADSDVTRLYINGKYQAQVVISATALPAIDTAIDVGNRPDAIRGLDGASFDDVKIFHRVLSDEEIRSLHFNPYQFLIPK